MPNFASTASPPNQNLQNNEPKEFGSLTAEEATAIKELRNCLILLPALELSYADGHSTVDVNVCEVYVRCVLLQERPHKTTKLVGYWS